MSKTGEIQPSMVKLTYEHLHENTHIHGRFYAGAEGL